jgi:tRNA(fMet)-specific endonuclease VapC
MHLLDSDALSHLHAGQPRVVANMRQVADIVGTTILTRIEVIRATFDAVLKAENGQQLLKAQARLQQSEELFGQLLIIGFDAKATREFDLLRKSRRLRRIGRADLLIASITLANGATLVTRNVRHFHQVPNLKVVNWVDT